MRCQNLVIRVGVVVLALCWLPEVSSADSFRSSGRVGIGLGSGTIANGLSAKFAMGKGGAFQANLGVWGGGGIVGRYKQFRGLAGSLDYLYEMPRMARVKNAFELAWSMGFGAGVGAVDFSDGPLVAGAFVLGLEFLISPVPMDVVIEYRPSILLVPKIGYDMLDFTGQVRWYF